MEMDDLIKYLMWVVVFIIAMGGIYFMLKRFGMV
jgi:hypothetical protein